MNKTLVAEALLIAFGMVSWPILGKYTQAAGPWVGLIVLTVTAVVAWLLTWSGGQFGIGQFPAMRTLLILAAGGVLNGAATYRYAMRTSGETQAGKYMVLVSVLMVLEAPVFDLIVNKVGLNPRQLLGVACGVGCVYLLNQK